MAHPARKPGLGSVFPSQPQILTCSPGTLESSLSNPSLGDLLHILGGPSSLFNDRDLSLRTILNAWSSDRVHHFSHW